MQMVHCLVTPFGLAQLRGSGGFVTLKKFEFYKSYKSPFPALSWENTCNGATKNLNLEGKFQPFEIPVTMNRGLF
jgi:hypothetical protein